MAFSRANHGSGTSHYPSNWSPPACIHCYCRRQEPFCSFSNNCVNLLSAPTPALLSLLPLIRSPKYYGIVFPKHDSNHITTICSLTSGCRCRLGRHRILRELLQSHLLSLPFSLPTSHVQVGPNDLQVFKYSMLIRGTRPSSCAYRLLSLLKNSPFSILFIKLMSLYTKFNSDLSFPYFSEDILLGTAVPLRSSRWVCFYFLAFYYNFILAVSPLSGLYALKETDFILQLFFKCYELCLPYTGRHVTNVYW